MADYDALVLVGGPGSPLDVSGNAKVHRLAVRAWQANKTIGALCYAVGALVWARNPETGKSIIWGKTIVAHPRPWDFTGDLPYPLYNEVPGNEGTDLVSPGFLYPLAVIVEDAVGPDGKVLSDPTATHEKPQVHYDAPFVTALSVESSRPSARSSSRSWRGPGREERPRQPARADVPRAHRADPRQGHRCPARPVHGRLPPREQLHQEAALLPRQGAVARAHAGYPRDRRPRHGDRVLGRDRTIRRRS